MADIVRDVFLAFARVHLLHHAAEKPIYGMEMMEELGRHGYRLSPGTLYPIFAGLVDAGFLRSDPVVVEGKVRKYYSITPGGRKALAKFKEKIRGARRGAVWRSRAARSSQDAKQSQDARQSQDAKQSQDGPETCRSPSHGEKTKLIWSIEDARAAHVLGGSSRTRSASCSARTGLGRSHARPRPSVG